MITLSPKWYTWLCGLFASRSIIFGYDLGVIAGVLKGLITSIFGSFFGMFPVAYAADILGRRKTILLGGLIYILGGALQTSAPNMDMMLAGRFFAGFGSGIMSDLAPLYQAEIAHPSIRGRLTTLQQFMLGIGAFVASWVTYGTAQGLPGTQSEWRIPLGIQVRRLSLSYTPSTHAVYDVDHPSYSLVAFIMLFPESPRWLAEKGRMEEAKLCLARLHAHGDVNDPFVTAQMEDIRADIHKAQDIGESTWSELFTVPSNFRRLSLGYILQFSVQMTGVSVIQYYSTTMGFSSTRILLFQSINSVIALIGEACCVLWVDHFGRRRPLISCIGPLSWAYPVEIYSTRTHIPYQVVLGIPSTDLTDKVSALCIWAFYPETSGRRLEEMDALFEDSIFVPGSGYTKSATDTAGERSSCR
ncbi:major facilitator superfamily domain-containing protein [Armillaria borealis]|uniref:Major facilitator superfamily domain-containing protein n=1 Tax=Armillaria borealis TaxID=47425 RepID=A0AA39MLP8_9AGAR|nr:major facilitator superfamily domain-containing protein [Armillaria borealis]